MCPLPSIPSKALCGLFAIKISPLQPGEILGIVGESGCGKSVLVNSLMGLLPYGKTKIKADTFMIDGNDCLEFTEDDWNELRGTTVAMVFQDPMTSLNQS